MTTALETTIQTALAGLSSIEPDYSASAADIARAIRADFDVHPHTQHTPADQTVGICGEASPTPIHPLSVPQSRAMHLFDAPKGRTVCGRKVPATRIAFPPDGQVSCADCIAAATADTNPTPTSTRRSTS